MSESVTILDRMSPSTNERTNRLMYDPVARRRQVQLEVVEKLFAGGVRVHALVWDGELQIVRQPVGGEA
jgi:hypothetical protein